MSRTSPGNDASDNITHDADNVETLSLEAARRTASEEKTQTLQAHVSRTRRASVLQAGGAFGCYRLVRLLGQGGFGQVWEAENSQTGRRLALKVLTVMPDSASDAVERFKREGRLAASLTHPSCVYIFGAEEIEGYPAITMELMPGGTLQDLLNKRGRLPVKQAVDYILSIIDGLEAAERAGIIHRDVKPSNCFLDAAGNVRIGDFGISKTLESDTKLTITGTYLGTPVYSSPEQVRGRDVDFRSDMYSVGATLYSLLTGKPPFEGQRPGEVLARILSELPAPFEDHHAVVPSGLQSVVFRLLAKEKEKRYPSYAALRAALMPYSSEGLMAASQGKRFAAITIDALILGSVEFVLTQVAPGRLEEIVLTPLSIFGYFFLLEKLWGRSVGKALLGLRVTTTQGAPITFGQAIVRTLVFVFFLDTFGDIVEYLWPNTWLATWLTIGAWFAVMLTMRRGNGYAGLHELASGTRVRSVRQAESLVVPELELRGTPRDGEPQVFGAYRITETIWETESEALLAGRDDVLDRRVWIHRFRDEASAPAMAEMAATRAGRLHWLQGAREPGTCWNAYEAPSGTSFYHWVKSQGKLSWDEMRRVLLGVATELNIRFEENDRPRDMSVHHLWIDAVGQPKLLDFPVVGDRVNGGAMTLTRNQWQSFLHQIVVFGLEGELIEVDSLKAESPSVPLPEYLRPVMSRLCGHDQPYRSLTDLIEELHSLAARPAVLTKAQRSGPLLATAIVPLAMVVYSFICLFPLLLTRSATQCDQDVGLTRTEAYTDLKDDWEENQTEPRAQAERRAVRMVLASSYAEFKNSPHYAEMKASLSHRFFPLPEAELEAAVKEFPALSETELAEARHTFERAKNKKITILVSLPLIMVGLYAVPAVLLSFALRGGLLLYFFGIAVHRRDGRRAGRVRCLARAAVVWVPWVAALYLSLASVAPRGSGPALTLMLVAGAVYSLIKPERGLPDLIAGTHLVPK